MTQTGSATKPPPSPPASRWGLGDVAGWYLAAFVGQSLMLALLRSTNGGSLPETLSVVMLVLVQLPQWLAYGFGPIITTIKRGAGPVADLGLRILPSDLGVGLAVGIFIQLVAIRLLYLPINRLIDDDPGEAARELLDRIDGPLDVILMFLLVVIMAPLVEELFYRGLLVGALRHRLSDSASIAISGVVFAAVHFQPLQFPGLLVIGLALGYLRVKYDRLGPAWAAHFAFNAVTFVAIVVA